MKQIYYITYSSIPSALPSSLQIIKTCENLKKNNYDVTLIKPGTGKKNITIKKYYGLKENIIIKEFSRFKTFPRGFNFYLYSFYCFLFIIKKKNPIIITRNYFISYLLVVFKKRVILEVHHDTNIEGRVTKFILKYLNFLNQKNLINIIAISKSVKRLFINKYNVRPEKITVLPSGSSLKIKQPLILKFNKRLKIGYFGALSPSKGINTLLRLSKIDLQNDYYIYGGSQNEISKINNKYSNKNLYLSKNIPYHKIPEAMMMMDILMIPYAKFVRSSGEVDDISNYTSPLKLFDYLAVGKIIISSNLKVLREIIGTRNAYFVDNFENIFEWKKNIEIIKRNRTKSFIISKNNFKLSKNYKHEIRVRKYL
jgi:glycosyltransferase involved in cell wall biosynthesis